jgi:hypothetical protein
MNLNKTEDTIVGLLENRLKSSEGIIYTLCTAS